MKVPYKEKAKTKRLKAESNIKAALSLEVIYTISSGSAIPI
jgi:hypothetical protein